MTKKSTTKKPAAKATPKKKAAAKKPAVKKPTTEKTNTFPKTLPVQLTDDELLHRGDAIAQAMDELKKVDATLGLAKEIAKTDSKKWQGIVDKLQLQLRRKKEDREVPCHEIKYFDERLARTHREDTGELVSTRSLRVEEMQRELALRQKADAKKGKKQAAKKATSDKPPKGTDYADTSPAGAFAGSDAGKGISTTAAPAKPAPPEKKAARGSVQKRGNQ